MAEIPREWVRRYSDMLNDISEQGKAELAKALARIDLDGAPDAVRAAVVEVMQRACGASATTASVLAAKFYDGLRERMVGEGLGATPDSGRAPEATARAAHSFVTEYEKDGNGAALVGKCRDRLDSEVRRSANETVRRNADRDPKKARYARVPAGVETCPFCIMLASRGFVYRDEELAGHAHPNCDCRVVPGWGGKGSKVEGYDPEYYLDCYKHPEDHPEIRDAINARRRELRAERKFEEASRDALHRKVSDEFGERTPADDEFVELYRQFVEKLGGTFRFVETEEERRYFEYFGIGGTTDSVGVILRPDPTMSDVIEEAFHYQQIVEGRFEELGEPITGCLREIEAKKFLLNNAFIYNILEEETIETERELEKYLTDLDRLSEKNGTDFSKYLRG